MNSFNYYKYLYNYKDIEDKYGTDKKGAQNHWLSFGMKEGRTCELILSSEDKEEYDKMNWQLYLFLNNINTINSTHSTHSDAWIHWKKKGEKDGKILYSIQLNKKNVYIISNITAGGTVKYIRDIVNKYQDNVNFYIIQNKKALKQYKFTHNDILFLQHLFFCDINISDIINIKKTFNCKLVISIHDWYWLNNVVLKEFDNKISCHTSYLNKNIKINPNIIKLFELADEIIHPSKFTYEIFSKYIPNNNFKLISHNDYPVGCTAKNIPLIKDNIINMGVLHEFSEYKGRFFINKLQKIKNLNGYKIEWKIVGNNIPKYNEGEFFTYLEKYNIHGLTLLNKWGETWCYSLTKFINSGLPIIYNNFGAVKERIPLDIEHYFKVFEDESESENFLQLESEYIRTDDIYKVISGLVKDSDEKLTVNLFRKWIDENREIIQTHYKNLP